MPLNLIKKYPELLYFAGMNENDRRKSLLGIYKRDIEDNPDFKFRKTQIYPIKSDGIYDMERQFAHLTSVESHEKDDDGQEIPGHRVFDMDRSKRLHWLNHHVHEATPGNIDIFEVVERDPRKRKDVKRTYIYDHVEKYVVVMENQRKDAYYLLTAYYLNKPYGEKGLLKKLKKGVKI